MINPMRLALTIAASGLVLAACGATNPAAQPSTVFFRLDAPFCGMSLPVRFSIDGNVVGVDTFRVNLSNPHLTTSGFAAPPGRHVLSAYAFAGTWPDTTVTLVPGVALTDTLPFYCS